jgi:hypothetical protein
MTEKYGLLPVIEEGTATYKGGSHLDQIFTNIDHSPVYQMDEWKDLTDHKSVYIEMMINTKRKQALRSHAEFYS